MAIVRWDPFRELASMQDRLTRLVGDAYSGRASDDLLAHGSWMPPVDIYSKGKQELVIKAEVPGLNREDIDLTVENDTLTIRGEKKVENDVKDEQFHRVERSYGSFSRTFSLPKTVDTSKVSAEYKNGVLAVRLPLREEAKPKQIKVAVEA
jgi:HSP20 family protein